MPLLAVLKSYCLVSAVETSRDKTIGDGVPLLMTALTFNPWEAQPSTSSRGKETWLQSWTEPQKRERALNKLLEAQERPSSRIRNKIYSFKHFIILSINRTNFCQYDLLRHSGHYSCWVPTYKDLTIASSSIMPQSIQKKSKDRLAQPWKVFMATKDQEAV